MKKILQICALCCALWGVLVAQPLAQSLDALDESTFELVNLYQQKGITSVQEKLESYLLSVPYWLKVVGERDVSYGYFQTTRYVFVSDKALPDLRLFKVTNQGFELLGSSSALVAQGKGHKKLEGDLTTPIGVYDLTARLSGLPPYYGPLAFATNYPNTYDRSLRRTGSGIWIHGLPLDGNREELNTKGCIAIDNELLKKYDGLVDYRDSIVIISEGELRTMNAMQAAQILAGLYAWKEMWKKGDLAGYLKFYDKENFVRQDGMRYKAFAEYKSRIFAKNEEKQIEISGIDIAPFPNGEGREMYRVNFRQDYRALLNGKVSFSSSHRKDLYVWLQEGEMKILSEK
ncbi:murein L,D-transpeptidase family protein [uncultured Helicobacter sp.]|uniref:L,D-transpeptidase family protein n=1 Tax=uncultured Helicobacter sp. TaxID=175537 RepID=UPI00375027DE